MGSLQAVAVEPGIALLRRDRQEKRRNALGSRLPIELVDAKVFQCKDAGRPRGPRPD